MRLHRKGLPAKQRLRIFQRDRRKCQKCGFDIGQALDAANRYHQNSSDDWARRYTRHVYGERAPRGVVEWQIHHRKPITEGGGDEDDNLELVCVHPNCHPKETAKLAARRALRRTYGQNARIPERLK